MKEAIGYLVIWALIIAAGFGWICNIIALTDMSGFTGMMALRIIGIFIPPLGAVLGYV